MHHVGQSERLDHVRANAVGAERYRVGEPRRIRVSDTIVEVRARVVEDGSAEIVVAIEEDAVAQQPLVVGEPCKTLRSIDVTRTLADVDVDAHVELIRQRCRRLERFVRAGERGVHTNHARAAVGQESTVLLEAAFGPRPLRGDR